MIRGYDMSHHNNDHNNDKPASDLELEHLGSPYYCARVHEKFAHSDSSSAIDTRSEVSAPSAFRGFAKWVAPLDLSSGQS